MPLDVDRAAVGLIEQREDVHQRRLARTALADDRDGLAFAHLERHTLQRVEAAGAMAVGLVDVDGVEDGTRHEVSSSMQGCK